MRAAIYLRQSRDKDGDEHAVDRQRKDIEQVIKARGWTVADEFMDNDVSASNGKQRPAFDQMMAGVDNGQYDVIVARHMDRLLRRLAEFEQVLERCTATGTYIVTAADGVDTSHDGGRLVARILSSVAQGEIERKAARQRSAAEQRAKAGTHWWPSRPFGFAYTNGTPPLPVLDAKGRPTLDAAEAKEIRRAYADVMRGQSLYFIAKRWNDNSVRTPKGNSWTGTQVRDLLLSPRNCAMRAYRGELVGTARWPAIVSVDTYEGAVAILRNPKRTSGKSRARKHLLSGLVICGECNRPMGSGVTNAGTPQYACKRVGCCKVSRNAAAVEDFVTDAIVYRLAMPDAVELVNNNRVDLPQLRADAVGLRARLDQLATEFADGELTASQLRTATARLKDKLDAVEAQMVDSNRVRIFDGLPLGGEPEKIKAKFAKLPLGQRRNVIGALVSVTILAGGRRTFDERLVKITRR